MATKEKYFIKEVPKLNTIKDTYDYTVSASTIRTAKILATKNQMFYDTILELYSDEECKYLVAAKVGYIWTKD